MHLNVVRKHLPELDQKEDYFFNHKKTLFQIYKMMVGSDMKVTEYEEIGQIVLNADDYLAETPIWSPVEKALYWINCENPARLSRWHCETGEVKSWRMPERIGGFALRHDADPVVCLGSGVYNFNRIDEELSLLAPSPWAPHVDLHESFVDRRGRLWVGSLDHNVGRTNTSPGGGGLCRLEGDKLIPMIPHMSVTNSLAFSPDGRTMYLADTFRRVIWRVDIEPEAGAILGIREFVTLEKGVLGDGAVVDEEGGYWLAIFGAGEVRRYTPDGMLERTYKMPFSQPTNLAFGGADLKTIYVTSAHIEMLNFERAGPNGAIYAFETDVTGLADELIVE